MGNLLTGWFGSLRVAGNSWQELSRCFPLAFRKLVDQSCNLWTFVLESLSWEIATWTWIHCISLDTIFVEKVIWWLKIKIRPPGFGTKNLMTFSIPNSQFSRHILLAKKCSRKADAPVCATIYLTFFPIWILWWFSGLKKRSATALLSVKQFFSNLLLSLFTSFHQFSPCQHFGRLTQ